MPDKYQIHSRSDEYLTGRFEVTLYKSLDNLENNKDGQLVFSKKSNKDHYWKVEKTHEKMLKDIKSYVK